jgi:hypothetical protein
MAFHKLYCNHISNCFYHQLFYVPTDNLGDENTVFNMIKLF